MFSGIQQKKVVFNIEKYLFALPSQKHMARPAKSAIRQNIVDMLFFMKRGYGYGIYKAYTALFPKTTMRNIYYHLRKGTATEELKKEKAEIIKGEYSWGSEAEKVFYTLGKKAKPKMNKKIKEYFDSISGKKI